MPQSLVCQLLLACLITAVSGCGDDGFGEPRFPRRDRLRDAGAAIDGGAVLADAAARDASTDAGVPADAGDAGLDAVPPDGGAAADDDAGEPIDADGDGFDSRSGDCDDRDPSVYPGADELFYDGIDQDCSGSDENDLDRDGFPGGAGGSDCDDLAAAVRPGAREVCGDHLDNDCDGTHNRCALTGITPLSRAHAQLIGESGTLLSGDEVAGVGDLNGDGFDDVAVTATSGDRMLGFIYVLYGPIGGSIDLADADSILTAPRDANAHPTLEGAGDTNGDGFDDFVVGLAFTSPGGNTTGHAVIVLGPVFGSLDLVDAGVVIEGPGNLFGFQADAAGDINGDGFGDVLLPSQSERTVYVLLGAPQLPSDPDALVALQGGDGTGFFGDLVAGLGDTNGDGLDDFLVTSRPSTGPDYVFVYHGAADFAAEAQPAVGIELADASCVAGGIGTVVGAGDMDRDGRGDMAVLCARLYVFTRALQRGAISTADADATVAFTDPASSLAPAGDVNGDGYADLLVGLQGVGALLITGPLAGDHDQGAAAATLLAEPDRDWTTGSDVDGAGDVDGDGFDDLIIGAAGSLGLAEPGGSYVVLGRGR